MLEALAPNTATVIVELVLLAIVFLIVRKLVRDHAKGVCACGCPGCSGTGSCGGSCACGSAGEAVEPAGSCPLCDQRLKSIDEALDAL